MHRVPLDRACRDRRVHRVRRGRAVRDLRVLAGAAVPGPAASLPEADPMNVEW
ncbi:hypothetical protein GCM10009675_28540 [Prauserella alba]|uniref:Uncharacterized protein n=1 Tax=Prauserella alba TaxID=176898 RepID=A0ABN1VE20_9PSEU